MKWLMILTGLLLVQCGPEHERATDLTRSTPLIDGLSSLEASETIRVAPQIRGHVWDVRERSHSRPYGTDEDFNELVVLIPDYVCNGIQGELLLLFYNDRLIATTFYPSDFNRFSKTLNDIRFDVDEFGRSRYPVPNTFTVIVVGTDVRGRKFVSWEDRRLSDAMDRWITRNS